jgi:hypothetical protein
LLAACATTPDVTGFARVTLESIEPAGDTGQVLLQLKLVNMTDTVMPVLGMQYRVAFDGDEFAYGVSRQAIDVPARGEAVFDIIAPGTLPPVRPGVGGRLQLGYQLGGTIHLAGDREALPFAGEGTLSWQAAAGQ